MERKQIERTERKVIQLKGENMGIDGGKYGLKGRRETQNKDELTSKVGLAKIPTDKEKDRGGLRGLYGTDRHRG